MRRSFIEALANRRSYYCLSNEMLAPDTTIVDAIDNILAVSPSPFNIQSARLIVLFNEQHTEFWDIVENTLHAIIPYDRFEATQQKLHSAFRSGRGTILFFEDENRLNELRNSAPSYADKVHIWSEQSNGMLQYAIWCALEDFGYGASLQHYNPIIDDAVRNRWIINPKWRLIAQMPFGVAKDTPAPRVQITPINSRRIIYGLDNRD